MKDHLPFGIHRVFFRDSSVKHGGLEPAFKGPHPSSSVVVVVMPKKKERSKNLFFFDKFM